MPAARIPRIIHFTCPDMDRITIPLWRRCLSQWRALHPEYEIRVRGDREAGAFIRKHAPAVYDRWSSIKIGACRADVYRYLVLFIEGGVYADLDCEPLKSVESLRARYDRPGGPPPVVLGTEIGVQYHNHAKAPGSLKPLRRDPRWCHKGMCLCQWCMMAARGSAAMQQAFMVAVSGLGRLNRAVAMGKAAHETVTCTTGPVAMTRAVCASAKTRAGVHILSSEVFCAGSHGCVPLTSNSYVKHHFGASWKSA